MQETLFYDGICDALEKSIAASGRPKKELAAILYPGRQIDTAKSLLSRALSPENTDVNLSCEMLLALMRETRAQDVLYFLCDEFGFDRPARKTRTSVESDIRAALQEMQDKFQVMSRDLTVLGGMQE